MEHEFQNPFEENSKCNISENELETFSLIVKIKEKLLEKEALEKQMIPLQRLMYELEQINIDNILLEQDTESSDDNNNISNEFPDLDYITMRKLIDLYFLDLLYRIMV